MKKEIGLYVHIPFCARKCAYCDFASFAGREAAMAPYVERMIREAEEKGELQKWLDEALERAKALGL